MKFSQDIFGKIHGVDALLFTLENENGIMVKMTNYGATILSVQAPDKNGTQAEITLCYNNIEELASTDGRPYFGCTVGRFANRICNGSFKVDGNEHKVAVNNGLNHLHGGLQGFDQKLWDYKVIEREESICLEYSYYSPDGEENYPGNLKVKVSYTLTHLNDLVIEYYAECDQATIVNLTNHAYWNLSGNCQQDLSTHDLQLACDHYLPLTAHQIPTGEIATVQSFPFFDFTETKKLDKLSHVDPENDRSGIDHCFVVNNALTFPEHTYNYDVKDQLSGKKDFLRYVGTLSHSSTGRELVVHTTQPGVQIYTGNYLSLEKEQNHPFIQHNAVCLETQHFPDAINHPHFPTVIVQGNGPDSPYYHKSVFSFRVKA